MTISPASATSRGESVVLGARQRYRRHDRTSLDGRHSIGDTAALQANLLSGDIDVVPGDGNGLSLDQVLAMQSNIRTTSITSLINQ